MIPSNPPDDELTPEELHERFDAAVNVTADELREFQDSLYNERYLESNSEQAQPGDEPLEDAIEAASIRWAIDPDTEREWL